MRRPRFWYRLRSRLTRRRLHIPPRSCPTCGASVWYSSRRNRSHAGRVFCSAQHKEKAAHPAPKVRIRQPPPPIECPFPHKVKFVDEQEARERRRTWLATDGQLHPYPCPAGDHWHVGHPPVDDGQRISAIARIRAQ